MRRRNRSEISADIAEVSRDIEGWRATRTKRSRMPDRLWEAAAALGRTHGIYRASRALHVSYESLKYRVAAGERGVRRQDTMKHPSVPFVELRPAPLTTTPVRARGSEVELVGAQGERMMIRLGTDERLDLAALAKAFLDRGA